MTLAHSLYLILRPDGSLAAGPFKTAAEARRHLDSLGGDREDNAVITAGLEVRRFVAADAPLPGVE